jgi:cysteine desulfurase / selenocysteine lyase
MSSAQGMFGPFGGRVWLNTAHQGPLPRRAAEVARAAVDDKVDPRRIADEAFTDVPARLRARLARLICAAPNDVVLANSTSYGLDLLAHGLVLQPGDEILVAANEFPATVYPWLPLLRRGVELRTLPAPAGAPTPDDLAGALTDRTRAVCTSWVFSFNGATADVRALVDTCRERSDALFVLNGSQAVGARQTDVRALGVDALVCCGFKWLCGPYATGFAWLRPEVWSTLDYEQGYWLAQVDDIDRPPDRYELRDDLGAAAYDVFCTANLATYPAWEQAIGLLLDVGIEHIEAHDQALVQRLIDGVPAGWRLRSPRDRDSRSTLVFLEGQEPETTTRGARHLETAGVDVAERVGVLRVSPHLHNTTADIDRTLEALAAVTAGRG